MKAVAAINAAYVRAKGKTFFAAQFLFDNPLTTDGFINDTLEHLRQNVRIGVARGDERQIEQNLQAFTALVGIYVAIDYSSEHEKSKTHANLAASYLATAVESVVPHKMPDVLMEGIRLMGRSAHLLLISAGDEDIVGLAEKIALIGCARLAREDDRPVTMCAVEELASLTFNLLRSECTEIGFAAGELKKNVSLIAKLVLAMPDTSFAQRSLLASYYSLTSEQTLGTWLTRLGNEIIKAGAADETVQRVIANIETWSEELHRTEKELLLAAIEKRSNFTFTFEIIHWIAHIAKVLVAITTAPACDEYRKKNISEHASRLISVLSWVPQEPEAVSHAENAGMTEMLFEIALDGVRFGNVEVYEAARETLVSWSCKGGRHRLGRDIFERSMCGLATLALWKHDTAEPARVKQIIRDALAAVTAPDQEERDRAARGIREKAAALRVRAYAWSSLERAMSQIDPKQMRSLLREIANLLSPHTVDEPVRSPYF